MITSADSYWTQKKTVESELLYFLGRPPFLAFSRTAAVLAGDETDPPFRPNATACGFFFRRRFLIAPSETAYNVRIHQEMQQAFAPGFRSEQQLDRVKHLKRMTGDSMPRPEEAHVPVHETVNA